jgi:oligogalacturonide lyase
MLGLLSATVLAQGITSTTTRAATAPRVTITPRTPRVSTTPHASTARVSWIDPDTGHRVIQLTPEKDSRGLYFYENAFTPNGKEMIYRVVQSIYVLNLRTHQTRQLVAGPVNDLVVGHKSPVVYFMRPRDTSLYVVGVNDGKISKVANLPVRATISTLNADETLAAGTYTEVDMPPHPIDPNLKPGSVKGVQMGQRLAAQLPMVLFTLDLKTKEVKTLLHGTDWLSHLQFSPTDPTLLMYCHEGLWSSVDRIWTIRTDGTQNQLIHARTATDEIAGHEFWDADGVTIWYDLQAPRGENFYVASYNTKTRERRWYHVERDAWSIHYNAASDDSIFCGDGGDYGQVAKSRDGQWIELFTPIIDPQTPGFEQAGLVKTGAFETQHLVNMSKQNYTLEPNVRFSPDHKLVIFNSNVLGSSYVFAVEVDKASSQPSEH